MKRIIYIGGHYETLLQDLNFSMAEIRIVSTANQFKVLLQEFLPGVILCDTTVLLPEIVSTLRSQQMKIPLIVLASNQTAESAVEAFRLGASDYLLEKDLPNLSEIISRHVSSNLPYLNWQHLNFSDKSSSLPELVKRLNSVITHMRDEFLLYDEVCSIIVEHGVFDFAFINIKNTETGELEVVASAGATVNDLDYFAACTNLSNQSIDGVRTGKKSHAFLNLDQLDLSSKRTDVDKLSSVICFPIKRLGEIIGTLNLFSRNYLEFDDPEITILSDLTDNISFAIELLAKEKIQRRTERRLQIEYAKLKQAQNTANFGTCEIDFETQNAVWSEELLRIFGLPTNNKLISTKQWLSMIHPDDLHRVHEARAKMFEQQKGYVVSHRIIRPNGEVRHLVTRTGVSFDAQGNPTILIGQAQDITDLHQTTEALHASELAFKQSESRYRQIVELANEGICLLNAQNQIVFANNRLSELLGYTSAELVGSDLFSFVSKKHKGIEKRLIKNRRSGEADYLDICFVSKEGNTVWTSASVSPVTDDEGNFDRTIFLLTDITARHEAEEINLFKVNLLNNIGQAVVASDRNGVVTFINKVGEKMFKVRQETFVGRRLIDIAQREASKEKVDQIIQTTKRGEVWTGFFNLRDPNGFPIEIELRAVPLLDDKGRMNGIICVSTDKTEHHRLERLLQSSVEMARLGHFEYNVVTGMLYWSDLKRKILEVDDAYVPHIDSVLPFYKEGASRDKINKALTDAVEKGTDWDMELELVTAKGRVLWVRSIGQVEKNDGRVVRVLGSLQDIDSTKSAEKSILAVYQERNNLLESIGDGFFAVDHNFKLTYCNAKAEDILSKKRENTIGKSLWEIYPEYIGSDAYHYYYEVLRTQEAVSFEAFFHSFEKWLHVSVYPSADGLSIFFKDITERKHSEMEMRELNENLQEYTKGLVAINRELEQFSYIVSHNLRAPVANIIGLAEELTDESYDRDTQLMFIDSLKISANRLNEVIADLSYIIQIKTDVKDRAELINLQNLTETVLGTIHHLIVKEDAEIKFNCHEKEILTAKIYLQSIIHNLVTNALKYRRPDVKPVIEIGCHPVDEGVELVVSDNGIGIDLATKGDEVFKMYKQFHSTCEGKGMGLFMVKTQVDIIGGTISIESAVNKGTVFRIFIPQ